MSKQGIHFSRDIQPYQTPPDSLSAGKAITLSSQMASLPGYHKDSLTDGRRLSRKHGSFIAPGSTAPSTPHP